MSLIGLKQFKGTMIPCDSIINISVPLFSIRFLPIFRYTLFKTMSKLSRAFSLYKTGSGFRYQIYLSSDTESINF